MWHCPVAQPIAREASVLSAFRSVTGPRVYRGLAGSLAHMRTLLKAAATVCGALHLCWALGSGSELKNARGLLSCSPCSSGPGSSKHVHREMDKIISGGSKSWKQLYQGDKMG